MRHPCLFAVTSILFLFVPTAWASTGPLPGGPKIVDCSKARDPARCEARKAARAACQDKRGDEKRACMDAYAVSPDCARSDKPKQCVARVKAENACKPKQGKAHKACMREKLKQK